MSRIKEQTEQQVAHHETAKVICLAHITQAEKIMNQEIANFQKTSGMVEITSLIIKYIDQRRDELLQTEDPNLEFLKEGALLRQVVQNLDYQARDLQSKAQGAVAAAQQMRVTHEAEAKQHESSAKGKKGVSKRAATLESRKTKKARKTTSSTAKSKKKTTKKRSSRKSVAAAS